MTTQRAARVAVGIEAAMDAAHDHRQQTKAYGDKARSLKYNLDTNEHLRFRVVVGQIDPVTLGAFWVGPLWLVWVVMGSVHTLTPPPFHHFTHRTVGMKPEDMQPEEHRQAAEAAAKLAYEASQLDWHDQNADKIRKKLGIEDVGGSFTCGRCKGNKTTYQAKQTRSSVRGLWVGWVVLWVDGVCGCRSSPWAVLGVGGPQGPPADSLVDSLTL